MERKQRELVTKNHLDLQVRMKKESAILEKMEKEAYASKIARDITDYHESEKKKKYDQKKKNLVHKVDIHQQIEEK